MRELVRASQLCSRLRSACAEQDEALADGMRRLKWEAEDEEEEG